MEYCEVGRGTEVGVKYCEVSTVRWEWNTVKWEGNTVRLVGYFGVSGIL